MAKDWLSAPWDTQDPGNGGTFNLANKGRSLCSITTAGAETRTIPAPDRFGQECIVYMDTDGGDATVTVTGGNGITSFVLDDAGDVVFMQSVTVAGVAKWIVIAVKGVAVTIVGAQTYSGLATFNAGATVPTGQTLTVADADKITSGGVIVATGSILVNETIALSASKVIYNLFVARDAWQVTHIDYTPDVAQGGALTATVVKAVTTATPASATTPMHIAGAIDLNAAAHTVQPITLTVTGADLQLAAGNRIAIVLSGAMTVGSGNLTIRGKRI
jgi:hypothetical protein